MRVARGAHPTKICRPRESGDPVRCGLSIQSLASLEYWVPAFAGTTVGVCRHNSAISPHVLREVCHQRAPPSIRGHGERRAPDAPAASCAHGVVSMHTSIHSESPELPGIPRAMVYGLYRALPGDRLSCHRRLRIASANLTPAPRRQDHTSSPSALASPVKRAVASTAARPASVTFAKRPSEWDGMAMDVFLIFRIVKRNILPDRCTSRITLNALGKLVFARRIFRRKFSCRKADPFAHPARRANQSMTAMSPASRTSSRRTPGPGRP